MPHLIETPEQEIQMQLGMLIWENTALRHEVAQLRRQLSQQNAPDQHPPAQPDLA